MLGPPPREVPDLPLAVASERSRTSQRTLLLAAALATLLLYVAAATAAPGSALGATTTTKAALCSANLRSTAAGSSRVRKIIKTGTLVTAVASVTGRSYSTTCSGKPVSGKTWLRVSAVNGKSVKSLLGVSYVYARMKTAATTTGPMLLLQQYIDNNTQRLLRFSVPLP